MVTLSTHIRPAPVSTAPYTTAVASSATSPVISYIRQAGELMGRSCMASKKPD